jgi:hypothetical protein
MFPAIVYVIAGSTDGVGYHFFDNAFRSHNMHGLAIDYARACDGRPATLDSMVAVNNVWVLPDGNVGSADRMAELSLTFGTSASPTTIVTTPNVVRRASQIAEPCFRDASSSDYAIGCATSAALDGTAMSLASLSATTPSALPGAFFSDRAARVLADPASHGAYQLRYP